MVRCLAFSWVKPFLNKRFVTRHNIPQYLGLINVHEIYTHNCGLIIDISHRNQWDIPRLEFEKLENQIKRNPGRFYLNPRTLHSEITFFMQSELLGNITTQWKQHIEPRNTAKDLRLILKHLISRIIDKKQKSPTSVQDVYLLDL